MLERVQRKRNQLVGMQTSTATMENSVEILQKVKNTVVCQLLHFLLFSPILKAVFSPCL